MLVRTPKDLGLLVRSRRRALGMDQRSLAAAVGVSRLWVVEFEKGKPRAEVGLVLRTLQALQLDLDATVAGEGKAVKSKPGRPRVDLDAIIDAARRPR